MTDRELEPTVHDMRALTSQVVNVLMENIAGLDDAAAARNSPGPALMARLATPPPEEPGDMQELLDLTMEATEQSYSTAGPSYLAYIPGGGIYTSALAGFLAAGLNRYTGKVSTAPALVALEASVLRWMCDLFDFPSDAQGVLTSGGSIANLTAVVAARTRHAVNGVDRATMYVGEHAHGSLLKAARTAGLTAAHVRSIGSTSDLRMDVAELAARMAADREAGLTPVCICGAAGTTNTGTVDPLPEIAALAREARVWFHVDGAYGGLFQLTGRGRDQLAGIELADSITLDPHKSLFLPFGTGALVVRSREALRQAFAAPADYMQDLDDDETLPDFDALTPELTRDFRGLRVWLPLHLHGVAAFRRQLDEKLDLARMAYEVLSANTRLEVPWTPDLTVVVFRLAGGDDEAQLEFLRRINETQRVLLSSTRLGGEVFLRIAILSARTHADRVAEALEIITEATGSEV